MANKDYNALAAEMLGLRRGQIMLPGDNVHQYAMGDLIDWNPLEYHDQAYELLEQAEKLGLSKAGIVVEIMDRLGVLDATPPYTQHWALLACPPDIMTKVCIDFWQGQLALDKAKGKGSKE